MNEHLEEDAFIWMSDEEMEAKADCGCRLVLDGNGCAAVVLCKLHEAAPTLAEFARLVAEMKTEEESGNDCPPSEDWIVALSEVIEDARAVLRGAGI